MVYQVHTRDDALNPTRFADQTGTWDYDYDTLNRLEESKSPDGPVPGCGLQPWEHPESLKGLKF